MDRFVNLKHTDDVGGVEKVQNFGFAAWNGVLHKMCFH